MTARLSLLLILFILFHFSLCDVVSWGQGDNGRLGNGFNTTLYSPLKLNSFNSLAAQELKLKTIKKISCGNAHCLILTGKEFL
jgi:alpha-tubulin suppressor-like RCC1 family protein